MEGENIISQLNEEMRNFKSALERENRILVVDDEEVVLMVLEELLTGCLGRFYALDIFLDDMIACQYRKNGGRKMTLKEAFDKAKEAGIAVIYVNSEFTSQTCPRCNHISRNNRKGISFRCEKCGYETHADRVGAMNIEHRTRDLRYILESQGGLVSPPDATRLFA